MPLERVQRLPDVLFLERNDQVEICSQPEMTMHYDGDASDDEEPNVSVCKKQERRFNLVLHVASLIPLIVVESAPCRRSPASIAISTTR